MDYITELYCRLFPAYRIAFEDTYFDCTATRAACALSFTICPSTADLSTCEKKVFNKIPVERLGSCAARPCSATILCMMLSTSANGIAAGTRALKKSASCFSFSARSGREADKYCSAEEAYQKMGHFRRSEGDELLYLLSGRCPSLLST